jgi:hypothetical protein
MIEMICYFPGWPPSEPFDEEKRAELINNIRVLYDAGAPFFTKRRLQEVAQQLEDCRQVKSQTKQKIFTRGIDGKLVYFSIETGRTRFGQPGEDEEFVLYASVDRKVEKGKIKI